ncbi:MAG: dTDP-4-dehydrorhamnose 3,5-epimerase family protein [Proteobacteria bacterium]|nr:dTDP-4-dehydrorhamnose 3,5-epimerase family protein [Pseudomonadota bacterium]
MIIKPTSISGVMVLEIEPVADHRGSFARLYCERELAQVLGGKRVVQINHSRTQEKGAVRGMHFQHPPHAEMKIVRCLKGRVYDVALDLRADSPTFLSWHAEELSPAGGRALLVPEGCAHGFQVLEEDSELLYLHTAFYEQAVEGGVRHDDPRLAIHWPLPVTDISSRDNNHALLAESFPGIIL